MQPIHLRNVPPPMETFDHVSFLSFLLSYIKPECYLELGVRDGRNFMAVAQYCKVAGAVDIVPPAFPMKPNMNYFQMSTDEFFARLDPNIRFDAVFIDADHSFEQSLKDFLNVKDRVIEDGFVFFHDTYPFHPQMLVPEWSGTVYKTALHLKQNFIDEFEVLTLPFNPGVTIAKKMSRQKQLSYI